MLENTTIMCYGNLQRSNRIAYIFKYLSDLNGLRDIKIAKYIFEVHEVRNTNQY